jgi:hypothetical protein
VDAGHCDAAGLGVRTGHWRCRAGVDPAAIASGALFSANL